MKTVKLNRCIDNHEQEYEVFYPKTREDIAVLLKQCREANKSVFPVSSGNNWGYGSSTSSSPATSCIMNLSPMPGVIDFDAENGLLTFGPSLTQGKLHEYLEKNNLPFMTPTTGAGPNANILGNLLERGFAMTPIHDHTESLMSLKAVLPNGSFYQSGLAEAGFHEIDKKFKWGTGPYLDMLFQQSIY